MLYKDTVTVVRKRDYEGETDDAGQPKVPHYDETVYAGAADVQMVDRTLRKERRHYREEVTHVVVLPDNMIGEMDEFEIGDRVRRNGSAEYRVVEIGEMNPKLAVEVA